MKNAIAEWKKIWKSNFLFKIYVFLICVAFAKQIIHYTQLVDTVEYINCAKNISHFDSYDSCLKTGVCDHYLHETRRTPGYPLFMLLTLNLPFLLIFIQCAIATFIPVLAFRILEKFTQNPKTKKYFIVLFLTYPLQYYYSALLMPELFGQFLLLLSVYWFFQNNWMRLSISICILIILKPAFILLLPIVFIFTLFDFRKRIALILPLFIFGIISIINMNQTGVFHYSSVSVENAWEYNSRAVLNQTDKDFLIERYYSEMDVKLSVLNFKNKYTLMQAESNKIISQHWKMYLFLHLKGCVAAILDPGRYDLVAFWELPEGDGNMGIKKREISDKWNQPWYILLYMGIFILINVARLFLVLSVLLLEPRKWILFFIIITIFIGITGPVGSSRYLFPLMPLICILAARGLDLMNRKNAEDIIAQ